MRQDNRKIRLGLWYDFRNPPQWHQSADRLYAETLDQIAWGESNRLPRSSQPTADFDWSGVTDMLPEASSYVRSWSDSI
jgi:hypothetical protein